jgi:FKBP-type peptidyl-prolyl cis-trans isomerase FkpA
MKYLYIVITALLFTFITGACKKDNGADCVFSSPPTIVAPATETAAVQAYLTANSITATQHSSGMFYTILPAAGTGNNPGQCSQISVRYTGRLTNGSIFDQATTSVSFYLYELINGWRIALPLIKAGQTIKLYIPPSLGYGSQQAGSVPPNSILVFDVELVNVN